MSSASTRVKSSGECFVDELVGVNDGFGRTEMDQGA